jgi:endonuclease/exonuclease/phosphatase family metal-dependent hydrolase
MTRIASFNVENLFARAKALNGATWQEGRPILDAYNEVNNLFAEDTYTPAIKQRMRELLVQLDIYFVNDQGAVRRKETEFPKWAWFRKNRGAFDRQPQNAGEDIEITADGRDDWIGWVELAVEPVNVQGTRMTARVIQDVNADILAIVEAEDRPSLLRFNKDLLNGMYAHVMLVDGNDERGIDVGIMTKQGFEIESIRSNVDLDDGSGIVFSRDCPQYEIRTPQGTTVHVLVNHFKSQSGGGGAKRLRQSKSVRGIVDSLVAANKNDVVLVDLNEGPGNAGSPAENLEPLYDNNSPLVECYALANFQVGARPGTFDSCGLRNRFDYIMVSQSLEPDCTGGGVFRKGLWGSRVTRPTDWETYPDIHESVEQASDHAAVFVDINI